MKKDLRTILSSLNNDPGQEKLLEYLNRSQHSDQFHEFEKDMAEDEFLNDAVEGLQEVKKKEDLQKILLQLNLDLKNQIHKRKKHKESRKLKDQPWIYFSIILILLLVVVAFLVIRRFNA